MNRDNVSFVSNIDIAPVNPFQYERELPEKDLKNVGAGERRFVITAARKQDKKLPVLKQ